MARLEAVKKVCDSVGRKLGDAVAQGQERVAELEARGEVSVDEVVCGISIVHNQYVTSVMCRDPADAQTYRSGRGR